MTKMVLAFGLSILVAYISSSSAVPSCVCTRNLLPVCGSDGVTYPNECLLECAQLTSPTLRLVREGSCDDPAVCVCPFNYAPVCGTDGQTYSNECSLECARPTKQDLAVRNQGECRYRIVVTQAPACVCPRDYIPVCGVDGKTYNNDCLLNCSGVSLRNVGICFATE